MAQFSRRTILAATDELASQSHSDITRFALEYAVERQLSGTSRVDRANNLATYLIAHPNQANEHGENLADAVVTAVVERTLSASVGSWPATFDFQVFQSRFPGLYRGLARDGFTVAGGTLRRALPAELDLPGADDEVHTLLDTFGFRVPKGRCGRCGTGRLNPCPDCAEGKPRAAAS
jgi:hypothetical protein